MKEFFNLLKKGNIPSLMAAIVNAVIAGVKGVAFALTGSVAMFAEMMHSIGDAANQFFVFTGSALSKKEPTEKFPNGFGRLINLVCLGAVLIVGYLSITTIKHGIHQVLHPEATEGWAINIIVLSISVILEFTVLYKACQHILDETNTKAKGFINKFVLGFKNLSKATPATRLVFMEDLIATGGGLVAIVGILIAHFLGYGQAEGVASVIIGVAMLYVVGKVFLENAAGAIGITDEETEDRILDLFKNNKKIKKISELSVVKEGESVHVDITVLINPKMTFAEADDIKDEVEKTIRSLKIVSEVKVELDEFL